MEALGALRMACLRKVPPTARAGLIILTGLQKRTTVRPTETKSPAAAHAGRTTATAEGTEESHAAEGGVVVLNVDGAEGEVAATVASTTSKRKPLTTAGSPGTTSQVQATVQGMTPTAASTKTEAVAGDKSPSQQTLWSTGQAGLQHRAGLFGGHYPQMFRIITPRGREEDLEPGTDRRRNSRHRQRQQILLKASLLSRRSRVTLQFP